MSGTAALAAARKRRANPQPVSSNSNVSNISNVSNKTGEFKEEIPKATNPAMLLMQHNMLIQRLQKEVLELKTEAKETKESKTSKSNDIDYKSEYLGLLEEMKEMKKVLLKVQSFSMETNLEVMKLKRIADSKVTESEKMDLSSITVTNEIDYMSSSPE
jgi:hypothetical protein